MFLNKLHLKTIEGDEAFYYRNLDSDFHGAVLTHVDDFEVTVASDFVEEIISVVEKNSLSIRWRKTSLDIQVLMSK